MSRQVCGRTSNGIYVTCKLPLIVVEYVNRIAARFFEKGSLGQVLSLSVGRVQIVAFSSLSAAELFQQDSGIDFQAENGAFTVPNFIYSSSESRRMDNPATIASRGCVSSQLMVESSERNLYR